MAKWPGWARVTGQLLVSLFVSWLLVAKVQPPSRRPICFVVAFILVIVGYGLSFLPNRQFWSIKLGYAVVIAISFRHWNIGFSYDAVGFLVLWVIALPLVSFLPSYREYRERRPWWPAVKRTIHRFRGVWREDDAQFAAKVLGGKK